MSELRFATIKEQTDDGLVVFETGRPVTFPFIHNTEKAPDMGTRFNQHIEPAGYYVTTLSPHTRDYLERNLPGKYEFGKITFQNPLVIDLELNDRGIGWKERIYRYYGKKRKKDLTDALLQDGYDGIVTVGGYGTSEIVALNPSRSVKTNDLVGIRNRGSAMPRDIDFVRDFWEAGESSKVGVVRCDPEELEAGIEIEMEHTNDPRIARKIALDHIAEWQPVSYYWALKEMERKLARMKRAR